MKIKLLVLASLVIAHANVLGQPMAKLKLTKDDSSAHMIAKYEYVNSRDGFQRIYLYKDRTFKYDFDWTAIGNRFSNGTWELNGDSVLILNSSINRDCIPVKIQFLDSVNSGKHYNTCFQIPVNLTGEELPDSRIFINDTSTFAFPFFDTLIGRYVRVNKIKIDFGNGIKSSWIPIEQRKFNYLLVIAQVEFKLASYEFFHKKRFRVLKDGIISEDD
jgi:hypothetical protein